MLLMFPRYDPSGIGDYYGPDFQAKMWVDELGDKVLKEPFQRAEVVGTGLEAGPPITWTELTPGAFEEILKEASSHFEGANCKLFALGTIFAPPKSVSLAALAGPTVQGVIIDAHRRAVGFVADLLARMLVSRKRGEEVPIRAHILRFAHPFSRSDDPQLHDHLEWIPDPRDGALHTYPWFFYQHALRQIYHYCLVAELATRGFGIEISNGEELRWELLGVDQNEVKLFSKRSEEVETLARAGCRESLPAALRWAALTSSKALPKFPGLHLGAARAKWETECPRWRCAVSRLKPRDRGPLVMPELRLLFRKSSGANLLTLQGRALALCLGQTCDAARAMREVGHTLVSEASRGRLIGSEIRGSRAFLMAECYRQEQKILTLIRGQYGMGRPLMVSGFSATGETSFHKALAVRNRIRIVSNAGGLPKELKIDYAASQEKGTQPPLFVRAPAWDVGKIGALMPERPAGDLVIGVQGPARTGDFLSLAQAVSLYRGFDDPRPNQRNFILRKGKGRSGTKMIIEVRSGTLPRDPEVAWMELENRPSEQSAVSVVPATYPEALRREVNFEMVRRLILSRPLEEASDLIACDFVVPRSDAAVGMEVVVFKNHPQYHLGTRWHIQEVLLDGGLRLAKARAKITMSAGRLDELADHLAIVEVRQLRLVPGMRLWIERSFSQRKPAHISLKEGEIVTVAHVGEDGRLVLQDGREIPSRFRAFSPAFLLRKLPAQRPGIVLAEAPGGSVSKRDWAFSFSCSKLIVFSSKPGEFAGELACENGLYKALVSLQRTLRFVTGEGEFVPSDSTWDNLLALQKLSVPGIPIPVSSDPAAIADGEKTNVSDMTVTPGHRGRKKAEEEPRPREKKKPEALAPPLPNAGAPVLPKRKRKSPGPTDEKDAMER